MLAGNWTTIRRETAYPQLWDGRVISLFPGIGVSGGTLYDWSGIEHHGTLTNMDLATVWSLNGTGYSLATDGTNDVVDCGNPSELLSVARASLSGWIYRSGTGVTAGFGCTNTSSVSNTNGRFSFIWFTDGKLYFAFAANAYGSVALSGTGWNHVVAVYDGSQSTNAAKLLIYVNGVQQTVTFSGTIPTTTGSALTPFALGKDASDRFCAGSYDDVAAWNRVLSADEVWLLSLGRGISYDYADPRGCVRPASGNRRRRVLIGSRA